MAEVPGASLAERKAIWEALHTLPIGALMERMLARDRAIVELKRPA